MSGGRRYFCNRKDEIVYGLIPGVKCVAPLCLGNVLSQSMKYRRGPPPPVAPLVIDIMSLDLSSSSILYAKEKSKAFVNGKTEGRGRYLI